MKRVLYVLLVASFFICGCDQKSKEVKPDEAEQKEKPDETEGEASEAEAEADHANLLHEGIKAYSSDNWRDSLDVFADDIVFTSIGDPMPPSKNKEELAKLFETFKTAFPDSKIHVKRIIDTGEVVAVEAVETGTHTGPLTMGPKTLEPTEKKYSTSVFYLAWFNDDDKIERYDVYANGWAQMAQFGGIEVPEDQVPPLADVPSGEPEIVSGDPNPEAVKVVKGSMDAWMAQDLDDHYAKDVVVTDYGQGETIEGREAYEKTIGEMMKAFSEASWSTDDTWSADGWVVLIGSWKAKHTGELMGIPPTEKMVSGHNADLFKVEDGKVVRAISYNNPMELMSQLKPPQEGAKEEAATE